MYYMKVPIRYYEARSLNEQQAVVSRQIFHSRKPEPQFYDSQMWHFAPGQSLPHGHVPHGHVTLLNYIFHASAHPVHGVGVMFSCCPSVCAYVGLHPYVRAYRWRHARPACLRFLLSSNSLCFFSDTFSSLHLILVRSILFNTWGAVTLRSLWSRYDRHFVGITRHNAFG